MMLLGGIILLAALLRIHDIGAHGIAGDEKYSLFVSQFVSYQGNNQKNSVRNPDSPYFTTKQFWSEKNTADFFDSIARVDTGNGAFYTYTLHWWTKIFGVSDTAIRMLPALFSILMVWLVFVFVSTHMGDNRLALIAAFLAAISPMLISFAQVSRNYAVLYFFALLSTHLFLWMLKAEPKSKSRYFYIITYGITAAICELNHLSTISLFFIHFIFLLLYHRNWSAFWAYAFAMLIPFFAVVAWLLCPGGAYLFEYVSNSVKVYNHIAETAPYEYLSKTSLSSIILQIRHVLSGYFIHVEGAFDAINGKKNGFIGFGMTLIAIILYAYLPLDKKYKSIIASVVALGAMLWTNSIQPLIWLNVFIGFYGLYILYKTSITPRRPMLVFLSLLAFIPLAFLVLFAFQDGNTFRIQVRYVGFGYVFAMLLVLCVYRNLLIFKPSFRNWVVLGIIFQLVHLALIITQIYKDTQPRYFMSYVEPREVNPYKTLADKIVANASPADTVIYCSDVILKENEDFYSVIDAQLTNFYLPKDLEIPQRIDINEPDKVYLKHADGSREELFDFEGQKYRY